MLSIRQKVVDILLETFPEDFKFVRIKRGTSGHIVPMLTPAIGPDSQMYISGKELGICAGFLSTAPTKKGTNGAWISIALPLDYEKGGRILIARLNALMLVMPQDITIRNSVDSVETAFNRTKQFLEME